MKIHPALYVFIGIAIGYISHSLMTTTAKHSSQPSCNENTLTANQSNELSAENAVPAQVNEQVPSQLASEVETAADNTASFEQTEQASSNQPYDDTNSTDFSAQLTRLVINQDNDKKVHALLQAWAQIDINSAIEWLSTNPSTPQFIGYYAALLPAHIEADITAARDIIMSFDDSEEKSNLMSEFVYAYAQDNPFDALDLTNAINNPELQEQSRYQIFEVWIEKDPEASLLYLSSVATETEVAFYNEVVSNAVMTATRQNPESATSAFYQFPEAYQAQMAHGIVSGWIESDRQATKDWIEQLPSGDVKNQAVQSFIDYRASDNYPELIALSVTVDKKSQRINMISDIVNQWHQQSPSDARDALMQINNISDEQKAMILESFDASDE